MHIVVECESCHSRFRVKRTLLEDISAIHFRCRACGGVIVVRNPAARIIDAAPSAIPPPEPETPAVEIKPAPSDSVGLEANRLEDLVSDSPEAEGSIARNFPADTGSIKRVSRRSHSGKQERSAWTVGRIAFFAGAGILLLAVGALHFWHPNPGSSGGATASLKPAYDIMNLETFIPEKGIAGNLFVITGMVRNVGKGPSRGIRVQATLFGKDNQVLLRQTSIAGNEIDKFFLSHMRRVTIEGHLAGALSGEGSGKYSVLPGNSVPFMVVCFEPPDKVERFEVLAADAEH